MASNSVNVLTHLRCKTQVDLDSVDLEAARKGSLDGPWADATSNQIEIFFQLTKPENADIRDQAVALSKEIHGSFPEVTLAELGVEVATVMLADRVIPFITGSVHVMANPSYAFSTSKITATGHRYHAIFKHINPSVDPSRVIMKVAATFEGMRACRTLKTQGIKTLATTVFTMEQAILAGEAGCISISPFVHELKAGVDPTYKDQDPLLDLCVKAQQYYEQHGIPTKVKACSCMSIDEVLQLSGVAAHTIPPEVLDELASMVETEKDLGDRSLFEGVSAVGRQPRVSYIDDESEYRLRFAAVDGGKGQQRLYQAISIFADYQHKAELVVSGVDVVA